jgi:soluble lytic murein transglycosylase-like protein
LRNWQVVEPGVEIEGEATVLDAEPAPTAAIADRVDEVVVAVLPQRRWEVTPGQTAALQVELINNGAWASAFTVTLEGWIDERWCPDLPLSRALEPGARAGVALQVAPPQASTVQAGEHPVAVVVHAAAYPGRVTRLAATLVVQPYVAFRLGAPEPRRLRTSWFRRTATLLLPLTNQSNTPLTLQLYALDRYRECDYRFWVGEEAEIDRADRLTLAAGQTAQVGLAVRPLVQPWMRLWPHTIPLRVTARLADDPDRRRSVDAQMVCAPLVGPWHLALLALCVLIGVLGSGLAGLALLLALRPGAPAAPTPVPAVVQAPAPVLALVLKMDEPAPTPLPPVAGDAVVPVVRPEDVTAPGSVPGVPVVRADQVTVPGEPLPPVAQTPLLPNPDAAPAQAGPPATSPAGALPRRNMTYGEMFQEIARQYDLNWQILAAVAYVESGFDSLALGNQGTLGLMQIEPNTWREWAPTAGVSDPFDSYSNVQVAAVYLDYLRTLLSQRGYPEQEWMLIAYNWGPDQLLDFLGAGGTWETLAADRRQYSLDVLRIANSIPAN